MPKDNKTSEVSEADSKSYLGVGIVFLFIGIGLIIPESIRPAGIPLLILGMTFSAIKYMNKPKDKPKK